MGSNGQDQYVGLQSQDVNIQAITSELKKNAEESFDKDGLRRRNQVGDVVVDVNKQQSGYATRKVDRKVLHWDDLCYSIKVRGRKNKNQTKTILSGMTGWAEPGQVLGILGPSGSGKTTLLNALAGRLPLGGQLSGSITINGIPRDEEFKKFTAYVVQDDMFFETVTVRETFVMAGILQLPRKMPKQDKLAAVEEVINELGLKKSQNIRIGGATQRGISGGERRRVSIGLQMIGNPSIMFLDEPTSGLDAFAAQSVISQLVSVARRGRTFVATIHQPRSSILEQFTNLIFLSEGKTVFFGSLENAKAHFTAAGFPCRPNHSPADHILDIISVDFRSPQYEQLSKQRIGLLQDAYRAIEQAGVGLRAPPETKPQTPVGTPRTPRSIFNSFRGGGGDPMTPSRGPNHRNIEIPEDERPVGWVQQFRVLLWRAMVQELRDTSFSQANLIMNIAIAIVLSLLYYRTNIKNKSGIENLLSLAFIIPGNSQFTQPISIISTFPAEKFMIARERANSNYSLSAYYFAKVLSDTPIRIIVTTVFVTIVYAVVRLPIQQFIVTLALCLVNVLVVQVSMYAVAAASRDDKIARQIMPLVMGHNFVFSGYLASTETMPVFISWLKWLANMRWTMMGIAITQLSGDNFGCDKPKRTDLPDMGKKCHHELMKKDFDPATPIYLCFVALFGLYIYYTILALIALKLSSRVRYLPLKSERRRWLPSMSKIGGSPHPWTPKAISSSPLKALRSGKSPKRTSSGGNDQLLMSGDVDPNALPPEAQGSEALFAVANNVGANTVAGSADKPTANAGPRTESSIAPIVSLQGGMASMTPPAANSLAPIEQRTSEGTTELPAVSSGSGTLLSPHNLRVVVDPLAKTGAPGVSFDEEDLEKDFDEQPWKDKSPKSSNPWTRAPSAKSRSPSPKRE